jgi:hypothetical protein
VEVVAIAIHEPRSATGPIHLGTVSIKKGEDEAIVHLDASSTFKQKQKQLAFFGHWWAAEPVVAVNPRQAELVAKILGLKRVYTARWTSSVDHNAVREVYRQFDPHTKMLPIGSIPRIPWRPLTLEDIFESSSWIKIKEPGFTRFIRRKEDEVDLHPSPEDRVGLS